jgi:hypothetical protein
MTGEKNILMPFLLDSFKSGTFFFFRKQKSGSRSTQKNSRIPKQNPTNIAFVRIRGFAKQFKS